MNNSLQAKLFYSFMFVIIVMLLGVSLGLSAIVKEQMVAHKQQELINKGNELAYIVNSYYTEKKDLQGLSDFLGSVDSFIDSRVWIIDKSRQVVAMSMPGMGGRGKMRGPGQGMMGGVMQGGMRMVLNELDPVFTGRVWVKTFEHPFYGEKMLVVAVPITLTDGSVGGAILLNTPVTGINDFMDSIYLYVGVTGVVAVLLALFVVSRLTRGIVRPLKAMQETSVAMAKGDYTKQVDVESDDEVGKLGLALNSLAHELAQNIAELESMEKLRRDFVANVSHELRTPLTIIRAYNEALMDGTIDDPEKVKEYHRSMQEETVRLERLIKDLLDLSRLQSQKIDPDEEQIPLATIADSVVTMMRKTTDPRHVVIQWDPRTSAPFIMGNGDRITQLLVILLDNAIKYTPAGGSVTVGIHVEQDQAVLTITDTGVGIGPEDLPYIWERFYKVNKSHSRDDSGTGLGLAIAKHIIDLHHGQAEVRSCLGQGTTFTIRFPMAAIH